LNPETVADERVAMDGDTFARERLGMWASHSHLHVIDPDVWRAAATAAPPLDGPVAFGVDMNPERTRLAVAAATKRAGLVHVEVVKHEPTSAGTAWVVDWLVARWATSVAVVIDGQSPARALVDALAAEHVKVTVTGAAELVTACGQFHDRVRDGTLTHFDQPVLNRAVLSAQKRTVGDGGGWAWSRKGTSDVSPLVAATLAMHGVLTSRRRPGRRATVTVL
jgi:hypothetical protein